MLSMIHHINIISFDERSCAQYRYPNKQLISNTLFFGLNFDLMAFNHSDWVSIPTLRTSMTQWTGFCVLLSNINIRLCTKQARISERKANEKQRTIIYQLKKKFNHFNQHFLLCCSVMSLLSSMHAKKKKK